MFLDCLSFESVLKHLKVKVRVAAWLKLQSISVIDQTNYIAISWAFLKPMQNLCHVGEMVLYEYGEVQRGDQQFCLHCWYDLKMHIARYENSALIISHFPIFASMLMNFSMFYVTFKLKRRMKWHLVYEITTNFFFWFFVFML